MRRRLILAALAVLPVIVMAFLVEGFVREIVVVPLLYVFWIGRLFFASIPQFIFWLLFLVVALVVAGKSLAKRQVVSRRRERERWQQGRVEEWLRMIEQRHSGAYFRWRFSHRIGILLLQALAHEERIDLRQARRSFENRSLAVPPAVRSFLWAGMMAYNPMGETTRLLRWQRQSSPLDLDPEEAVQFLEDVQNGRRENVYDQ